MAITPKGNVVSLVGFCLYSFVVLRTSELNLVRGGGGSASRKESASGGRSLPNPLVRHLVVATAGVGTQPTGKHSCFSAVNIVCQFLQHRKYFATSRVKMWQFTIYTVLHHGQSEQIGGFTVSSTNTSNSFLSTIAFVLCEHTFFDDR